MRVARVVTGLLVAGSASLGFLPLAHAASTNQVVTPSTEAWFQPNPTCATPAGCVTTGLLPAQPPAEIPTSPFPAGTLHVGWDAGQETARTYLAFSLSLVDQELTAAALDVPLDVAPADGSVTPEAAKVLVCAFTGSVTSAAGSLATPPAAQCAASAPAAYVATPSPHLHADLTALRTSVAEGAGLVLLPDAAKSAQTDAWRVVFSAHDRTDAGKTPPASLAVTLTDLPQESPPPVPVPEVQPPAAPPLSGVAPGPTTVLPPEAPTVTGPAPAVPTAPVPQARTVTVGYAYPTVWLLPLAFLVVVPLVARSLTRDLVPAG